MSARVALLLAAVALLTAGAAPAGKAAPAKATGRLATAPGALAPLPAGVKAASSHGPFLEGNCSVCHQKNDPRTPGPLTSSTNGLCFGCHEELEAVMQQRPHQHQAAVESCSNCHAAHDVRQKELLLADGRTLCLSCHGKTQAEIEKSKVVHGAVVAGSTCTTCHDPHASNVEKLLVKLPFDLCVGCHSTDGLEDAQGRKLTNFKRLLAENPDQHAPVASKDCSACHRPHAGENFRLLTRAYPAAFEAPFEAKNYSLCFDCHDAQIVAKERTGKLTRFRDGDRNLHYVHVHGKDRGLTCRACHDVHAGKQIHLVRAAAARGPEGGTLEVGYTPTPTGGACATSCHATKSYDHGKPGDPPAPGKK